MAAKATSSLRPPRRLRLFFALWPQPAAAAALWQLAQSLHRHSGGRSTPRDDLHLTLGFLGPVKRERLAGVMELGAAVAAAAAPFKLTLDRAGCWPRQGIVWAAPAAAPEALFRLASQLGAALPVAGVAPARPAFRPHVTLLRDVAVAPAPAALDPLEWPVRELVLAASRPGPRGPRYRAIGRWPLSGPGA